MNHNEFVQDVATRCEHCGKAHYDENFFKCVECGAPLETKANPVAY